MVPGGDRFPLQEASTDWPGALLGASWAPFGQTGRPRTLQESPEAPQELQQHHFWDAKWSPKGSQHNIKTGRDKTRPNQQTDRQNNRQTDNIRGAYKDKAIQPKERT